LHLIPAQDVVKKLKIDDKYREKNFSNRFCYFLKNPAIPHGIPQNLSAGFCGMRDFAGLSRSGSVPQKLKGKKSCPQSRRFDFAGL